MKKALSIMKTTLPKDLRFAHVKVLNQEVFCNQISGLFEGYKYFNLRYSNSNATVLQIHCTVQKYWVAVSNDAGIICPLVRIGLTDLPKKDCIALFM